MRRRRVGLHLVLMILVAVTVIPLLWVFLSSVKSNADIMRHPFGWPQEFHFENFTNAWFRGKFNTYFLNTVIMTVPAVLGVMALATLAGYALAQFRFVGRRVSMLLWLAGLSIPVQALMIPLFYRMRDLALINTMHGLIIALIAIQLPFSVLFMTSFFSGDSSSLSDAAKIDGCNDYGVFWYVMLPLARPALMTLMAVEFMWIWKAFLFPLLIIQDANLRPLTLGLVFFRGQAASYTGQLAAAVIIASLPIILVYLAANRYFQEGITAGSAK